MVTASELRRRNREIHEVAEDQRQAMLQKDIEASLLAPVPVGLMMTPGITALLYPGDVGWIITQSKDANGYRWRQATANEAALCSALLKAGPKND
jgi:hypothetical protein